MVLINSFMVLNVSGGQRISFTYDVVDEKTGKPLAANNKESYFVTTPALKKHVEAIFADIRENHLESQEG